ncbi:sulfatase [Reichenbachiella carrageenanivorans]|uniref:Sulfatase n=1 Tax=Reichenbachiella carrageenanivorans TaxID=2979869 RepID=A0ABY6D7K1_9BACT|nr:sulfatase [Reichenbachiella carrageenanivorans]UXX81043.1 sulfatase [Reichenbachiella carrageenanivorans]
MKNINILCFFLVMIAMACQPKEKVEEIKKRPNIIWLVAEDLSPRFSFYGDSTAYTPAIDAIAAKGVVYENAFTVSGVCAPSRSSMITGCYPSSIGTQHMRQSKSVIPMPGVPNYNAVPPAEIKAFPELLRAAGYWTASYRKLDYQFGAPFTIWDEVGEDPHWRHRREEDKDKPFFIYSTYEITHEVNIWPDSTKEKFFLDKKIDPMKLAKDVRVRPPLDTLKKIDVGEIMVPPYLPNTELARGHIQRLYYNTMRMDQQIARLMADLKADGLEENTIIFFMSDHGDCLPRAKRWINESGTKVPLVIYIPDQFLPEGFVQKGRDNHLYSYLDLPPTVLEMAGVAVPDWIQGHSIISDLKERPRQYVYGSRDRMDNKYDIRRAVRDEQYRYIKNFEPLKPYQQQIEFLERMPLMSEILKMKAAGKLNETQAAWLADSKPEEELYDLKNDPFEIKNLSEDSKYESTKLRLSNELSRWMDEINDMYQIDEKEQAESAWPNGERPTTKAVDFTLENGRLSLSSITQCASIAYRTKGRERWEIYMAPLNIKTDTIEAKAVRYGFEASEITTYTP